MDKFSMHVVSQNDILLKTTKFWCLTLDSKTRSGKIMRHILRKIVENDLENIGDTSTLADPNVVDELTHNYINNFPRS